MAPVVKKENTVKKWRCSYCNRTANSSVKPVMTYGGKCNSSPKGMHSWKKES